MNSIGGFIKGVNVQGHKSFTEYIRGDAKHSTSDYDDSLNIFILQKNISDEGTISILYQEALKNLKLLQDFYI